MAQTVVRISTLHNAPTAVGWAGSRTLTIDRPVEAGGMGLGYSGGELLLLALGACYTNDIFREAAKQGIDVRSVAVEIQGDWGGDPIRAQNKTYSVTVEARAPNAEIQELIAHTDRVAEIHNSLRIGTDVTLVNGRTISVD
jgi:putative redox protein